MTFVMPKVHPFEPFRLDAANQWMWRGTEQRPEIHVTDGVLKRAVPKIRRALAEPRNIQILHRRGHGVLCSVQEPTAATEPDQGSVEEQLIAEAAAGQFVPTGAAWLESPIGFSDAVLSIDSRSAGSAPPRDNPRKQVSE